jgi:hypothetical protein
MRLDTSRLALLVQTIERRTLSVAHRGRDGCAGWTNRRLERVVGWWVARLSSAPAPAPAPRDRTRTVALARCTAAAARPFGHGLVAAQLHEVALDVVRQRIHHLGGESIPLHKLHRELACMVSLANANEVCTPIANLHRNFKDHLGPGRGRPSPRAWRVVAPLASLPWR